MTNCKDTERLIERLLEVQGNVTKSYRNPEGPEAVCEIRRLEARHDKFLKEFWETNRRNAELEDMLREGYWVATDLINKTDMYLGINDAYDRHDKWEKQVEQALGEKLDE